MNIVVRSIDGFEKKKETFKQQGLYKVHVVADFDKTLTKAFVNGEKVASVISLLRKQAGEYLTSDYAEKAQALFNKYHPIEENHDLSLEERKKAMEKWWREHFDLLIRCGLNKGDLERLVSSSGIELRKGVKEFVEFLKENNIPLIIFSASGIGDSIQMIMKKERIDYDNVYYLTNCFEFDSEGKVIEMKEPVIHSLNKDETSINNHPVYNVVKNRKNVILLGDSLDDLAMVSGFDYDNLVSFGFYNPGEKATIDDYEDKFDIVILDDGSFESVNRFMEDIK